MSVGDLARSPRAMYHLHSLLDAGCRVRALCQVTTPLPAFLINRPNLVVHTLGSPAPGHGRPLARPLFLAHTAFRLLGQGFRLATELIVFRQKMDWIIVLTPPAIPTLWLARLAARLRGAKVMVDWHNFGYSLLALKLDARHRLVRRAQRHEWRWGGTADVHLCVSRAMAEYLSGQGMHPVHVFHDHPPRWFSPIPESARHRTCAALREHLPAAIGSLIALPPSRRPAVLIGSSSWTTDEDFSLLLGALPLCAAYFRRRADAPAVLVLLTGKGAGQADFERRLAQLALDAIEVRTLWVAAEAYPTLLALADLGLCFHRSSSALDIPMKVVDMLGAGIPVCAYDYGEALAELLIPGRNGMLFKTAEGLAQCLRQAFTPGGHPRPGLLALRAGCSDQGRPSWENAWQRQVWPLLVKR